MEKFAHGGNIYDRPPTGDWLDFSANLRPGGPPDWVREALSRGLKTARYYPDPDMKRAVRGLSVRPDLALVDGNRAPDLDCPLETVVKGDGKSASIAAASILAKVSRDRYMLEMAKEYPQYAFEKHKGYPTKLHYERLREYGPCPIHRLTFLKKL